MSGLALLLGLGLPAPLAAASEPLPIVLEGALPFTASELQHAVSLRLQRAAIESAIEVRAFGPDAVHLEYRDRRRTLPLLGLAGPAAARRVALAIGDLVRGDLEVDPAPLAPIETATLTAIVPPTPPPASPPPPAPTSPPSEPELDDHAAPYTISALVRVAGGAELERVALGGDVDATLRVYGPLRALAAVGLAWAPPIATGGAEVTTVEIPLRLGLAWRLEELGAEARASAFARILSLGGGDAVEEIDRTDVLPGAGLSIFARLPLGGVPDLALAAGADVAFEQRDFRLRGARAFSSERLSLWVAIGISFEEAR